MTSVVTIAPSMPSIANNFGIAMTSLDFSVNFIWPSKATGGREGKDHVDR
jgi:hypothetical protein